MACTGCAARRERIKKWSAVGYERARDLLSRRDTQRAEEADSDAAVEVSTEDGDNFRTNMVTIRAEERLALAVYRPESFVHGEFEDPTP